MQIAERTPPPRVVFSHFQKNESTLPGIMALVEKDLSEPYSVFTYRYFVLGWPELTILAHEQDDGKLLGVIVCKVDRGNRRRRLRGYIAMLAVEKEHRKRGIGSHLAYQALLKMKHMGCDEVVLETEYTNSGALSLYERLGFTRDKRLCRYYLNGGDAFRLKLWFTSPSWDDSMPVVEESSSQQLPIAKAVHVTDEKPVEEVTGAVKASKDDATSDSPRVETPSAAVKSKKHKKKG